MHAHPLMVIHLILTLTLTLTKTSVLLLVGLCWKVETQENLYKI